MVRVQRALDEVAFRSRSSVVFRAVKRDGSRRFKPKKLSGVRLVLVRYQHMVRARLLQELSPSQASSGPASPPA